MAWTAELVSIEKKIPGLVTATVRYTDGTRTIDDKYKSYGNPGIEWLQKQAKGKLDQLEGADIASLPIGPIGNPTPPDAALYAFRQDLRRLDVITKLVALGVLAVDHIKVMEFMDRLRDELITYWDKI